MTGGLRVVFDGKARTCRPSNPNDSGLTYAAEPEPSWGQLGLQYEDPELAGLVEDARAPLDLTDGPIRIPWSVIGAVEHAALSAPSVEVGGTIVLRDVDDVALRFVLRPNQSATPTRTYQAPAAWRDAHAGESDIQIHSHPSGSSATPSPGDIAVYKGRGVFGIFSVSTRKLVLYRSEGGEAKPIPTITILDSEIPDDPRASIEQPKDGMSANAEIPSSVIRRSGQGKSAQTMPSSDRTSVSAAMEFCKIPRETSWRAEHARAAVRRKLAAAGRLVVRPGLVTTKSGRPVPNGWTAFLKHEQERPQGTGRVLEMPTWAPIGDDGLDVDAALAADQARAVDPLEDEQIVEWLADEARAVPLDGATINALLGEV